MPSTRKGSRAFTTTGPIARFAAPPSANPIDPLSSVVAERARDVSLPGQV
jgi:hypothetical protein